MVNIMQWLRNRNSKINTPYIPRPGEVIAFEKYVPTQVFANYKLKRKATLVLRKEEVQELAILLDYVLANTPDTEMQYAAARFHKMLHPRIRVKTVAGKKPRKRPQHFTRKKT